MTWLWVGLAVLVDGAIALIAGLIPNRCLQRHQAVLLGFATGALLASGLGEILPEAIERGGPAAIAWAGAGLIVLRLAELVSQRSRHHASAPVPPFALLGSDALHNIADGIAIAAAFLVSARVGAATAAGVVLHEVPEEIADYALLRAAGMTKRRALVGLAAVQLTAGIGAAATLLASSTIHSTEGLVLGLACGMFVYIAVIDLVPALYRSHSRTGYAAVAFGAIVTLGLL